MNQQRIHSFDNLRWFLSILVIIWHSANAYIGTGWPISEEGSSLLVSILISFLDAIIMPLFFYIAGYFSEQSFDHNQDNRFLKKRAKKILLPWIFGLFLIVPLATFLGQISSTPQSGNYLEVWINNLKNFLTFETGVIEGAAFYQRYLWFLGVLFTFVLIFYIIKKLKKVKISSESESESDNENLSKRNVNKIILGIIILGVVLQMVNIGLVMVFCDSSQAEPFFSVLNIFQFQTGRLPLYIIYFVFGVYTCKNNLIKRGFFKENLKKWSILFYISLIIHLVYCNLIIDMLPAEISGPLFCITLNVLIMSSVGYCCSIFQKYFEYKIEKIDTSIAFEMYLSHYLYVYALQLLMFQFPGIPLVLKFLMVSILSILLAYFTSKYILKKHKTLALVALIGLNLILFLV